MDSSGQQRTPTRRSGKFKKKPIKIVYISSPMMVKVTASGFMALVQELTGQDAEFPTDLSRFQNPDDIDDRAHQTSDSDNSSVTKSTVSHESDHTLVMPQVDPSFNNFQAQLGGSMKEGFDPFDHDHHHHHAFAPDQTMDDISAFLLSSVFYESDLVDEEPHRNNGAV